MAAILAPNLTNDSSEESEVDNQLKKKKNYFDGLVKDAKSVNEAFPLPTKFKLDRMASH